MDPVELLDILGNENRRRILQLLSFRPFYFNEMAKRLDVGPKAVIDHLVMLERAGLVECYQDQGRRKYFRIARKTVLEIAVSPHSYGVRAYLSENAPKMEETGPEDNEPAQDMKMLRDELILLEEKTQRTARAPQRDRIPGDGDQTDSIRSCRSICGRPAGVGDPVSTALWRRKDRRIWP